MKKHIFVLIIILIITALSLTIIIKSVNGNNNSNLVLAEEEQMNNENNQENVIEVAETKENNNILDDENDDQVQIKTEITEKVDQSQIIETQKEEKKEGQQEITKQETTQISDNKSKTENKVQVKSEVKKDTTKQENTAKNIKKEQTPVISQSNSNYTEKEVKVAPKTECIGNNHKMSAGNTGKWFETKTQADSYYNAEINKWGKKWENGEIDKAEYLKKCPSGYEVWTCPQCQKWTINFYYR